MAVSADQDRGRPEGQVTKPRNRQDGGSWPLYLSVALFLVALAAQILTSPRCPGIVALELTPEVSEARRILVSWGSEGIATAQLNLKWDFFFIVTYVVLLLLLIQRAWCWMAVQDSSLSFWLVSAPILAGVLDSVENVALLDVLSRPESFPAALPVGATVAALLKFSLLIQVVVVLVCAWIGKWRDQRSRPLLRPSRSVLLILLGTLLAQIVVSAQALSASGFTPCQDDASQLLKLLEADGLAFATKNLPWDLLIIGASTWMIALQLRKRSSWKDRALSRWGVLLIVATVAAAFLDWSGTLASISTVASMSVASVPFTVIAAGITKLTLLTAVLVILFCLLVKIPGDLKEPAGVDDVFKTDLRDVIESEEPFLKERREHYQQCHLTEENRTGFCLSGGGIRSATFGLGVLQRLISENLLKYFDYMSTVSGGGYIGSCLSSLLTEDENGEGTEGVQPKESPLWGLNELDEYSEEPRLGVRHQLHHLRTHGEYLRLRRGLFGRDLQRAVGALISGTLHNVVLFLLILFSVASVTVFLLSLFDPGLRVLAPDISRSETSDLVGAVHSIGPESREGIAGTVGTIASSRMEPWDEFLGAITVWYQDRLEPPLRAMISLPEGRAVIYFIAMGVWGFIWAIFWLWRVDKRITSVREDLDESELPYGTPSGWGIEEHSEFRFLRLFNMWSVIVVLLPTIGIGVFEARDSSYLQGLMLPFMFSVGGALAIYGITNVRGSIYQRTKKRLSRTRRSFFGGLQGACVYGMVAAIAIPILMVALLSLDELPMKALVSLIALAIGSWIANKQTVGTGWAGKVFTKLRKPILNLAVMVFLVFGFAAAIAGLLRYAPWDDLDRVFGAALAPTFFSFGSALVCVLVLVLLSSLVDSNRVSPHYFYRDRLTEAYLKTDARVTRDDGDNTQGMPLKVLRDHEKLELKDLGGENPRGPYHLIVTALNLSGSNELNRKSDLSDHFVFARDFIGSETTGYVRTDVYRNGETRLARAMTISGAAVSSAMGYQTFWAQSFMMTVLNVRLGFWMPNPWNYRSVRCSIPYWTFWPKWLFLEFFGRTTARDRLVNLSDGGHTGDNVGLLPLLRRRCTLILVCDAECDDDYSFGSFNNALRMAYTEANIEVEIDLSRIRAQFKDSGGSVRNQASIAVGTIKYPQTPDLPAATGTLVYLKSSVSGDLPVQVANYLKEKPCFPHQATVDQFFDDAQFEAYRSLGFHIAGMASKSLREAFDCD